jgi:drug/metabolite transporter (DMT)-like permease
MWMAFTLLTFICWGVADLFYKMGNHKEGEYNHLKTGIMVGLVMGIHAIIYMIVKKVDFSLIETLKYLPVSLCYILSMVIGYRGLKYLELSISSPVQNTSGVITALLLLLFFKEKLPISFFIALVLIFSGIIIISILEVKDNKNERKNFKKNNSFKKFFSLIILFPICYCILDGLGTFLDGIYLDKLELISEDSALLSYEFTFLIYAIITTIYLRFKKEKLSLNKDKAKISAAIFETIGQFFYVFAMADDSVISATIIGSYFILSLILSRIFLKEKLNKISYLGIGVTSVGIIILSILGI